MIAYTVRTRRDFDPTEQIESMLDESVISYYLFGDE